MNPAAPIEAAQATPVAPLAYVRWLVLTALTIALTVGVIELNYHFGLRCPRNEIDIRLRAIERLPARHFRAVLLSDSMTHNPVRDYRLSADVLDLTTTNGPTLLGAKFMVERVFRRGASTDDVVLFLRPEYFNRDLAVTPDSIFLSFSEPPELADLGRYGVSGYKPWQVYIKNRFDSLNVGNYFIVKGRLPKGRWDPRYALERGLVPQRIHTLTKEVVGFRPASDGLLREFSKLCRDHGTRLTIVLEPLTREDYAMVAGSPFDVQMRQLHDEGVIRYVDANHLLDVSDEMFFDGVHPWKNWGKYYLLAIDRDIVKVF